MFTYLRKIQWKRLHHKVRDECYANSVTTATVDVHVKEKIALDCTDDMNVHKRFWHVSKDFQFLLLVE